MSEAAILRSDDGPIATLTISNPERQNALTPTLISELTAQLHTLANDRAVRIVVLTGAGRSFCAGVDLQVLRESLAWTHEQALADAEALATLLDVAWRLPKPLIAQVNGAAAGSGACLVACCDLAVAAESARFSFGEVKLGLLPAVIAQYIVPKIGVSHARALFVSGEQITPERAFEIGLVHAITTAEDLDATVGILARRMLAGSPQAIAAAKQVVDLVWNTERAAAHQLLNEASANARSSSDGQEGVRAFLEKRKPAWLNELPS